MRVYKVDIKTSINLLYSQIIEKLYLMLKTFSP